MVKRGYVYLCWIGLQHMFSGACLRNPNEPSEPMFASDSTSSEWLAGVPTDLFARDPDVLQHPVVQQIHVLPSLPARQPHVDGLNPTRKYW